MKINYVFYGMPLTGGIRTMIELANRLSRRGHEVGITALERRVKFDMIIDKDIKIKAAEFPRQLEFLDKFALSENKGRTKADLWYLQTMLNRCGIDVAIDQNRNLSEALPKCDVLACTFSLSAFAVDRKSTDGIKVYHTQHYEPYFFDDDYYKNMAKESYFLPLTKIACSTWLKQKLATELNQESIFVPWGIDTDMFNTKKVESKKFGQIFESDRDALFLFSLGNRRQWKGLNDLFDALRLIKKRKPNFKMHLILFGGEWGGDPELQKLSPVPCTYLYNLVGEDLVYIYQNVDIVITSSWYECFPLPPLEGMACGAKVITTKYGTEDYAVNNVNSLVILPRNPRMLADAIIKLANDEEQGQTLVKNGQKTALKFNWERSVKTIEKIYKKKLNDNSNL